MTRKRNKNQEFLLSHVVSKDFTQENEAIPEQDQQQRSMKKFRKHKLKEVKVSTIESEKCTRTSVKFQEINKDLAAPNEKCIKRKHYIRMKYPFETDYCDHFETPFRAFDDISAVLENYSNTIGRTKSNLKIWDPFYCEGRVVGHLSKLGFSSVYNENEDFYRIIEEKREPPHDIIVTNPPYSGDHKKFILEYCAKSGKPWLVLVPNYIAIKDYYRKIMTEYSIEPFYIMPKDQYEFTHPEGTGHEISPFSGMWYIFLGYHTSSIFNKISSGSSKKFGVSEIANARCVRTVKNLVELAIVPTVKRKNPRQRKAAKKRVI